MSVEEKQYRVLYIEDDDVDQLAFKRAAKNKQFRFDYAIADTVKEAFISINDNQYDLIIADYLLGDGTAFDIIDQCKNIPIIIVTSLGDEEIAVKAMKAGAYDYVIKDTQGNYLKTIPVLVERSIKIKESELELERYHTSLEKMVEERTQELTNEIEEKKRFQKKNDELAAIVEQLAETVIVTNLNGKIEYVNPKFMQMSGYEAEDVLGKNPRIFQSGSTTENIYTELWDAVLAGRTWSGTFENKRKNHSPYFVSATISPIVNKSGKITSFIAIQEDITEQKRLQEELEKLATIDGLTGAFNRGHFMNLFTHEMKRTIRYDQDLSVLAFDLDFFKDVNDTYGHHGGDLVLQAFTEVVKTELRESDFLGRLGGEEFCAVLVQTGKDGALQLAERLRLVTEAMRVPCDDELIKVTVSIGVTEWSEGDLETEHVLKRADKALYAAKAAGRNQVKILLKGESTVASLDMS